jgi:hypothetical protein
MGQTLSSTANNQDQDGDVIMVDDSESNIGDANGLDFNHTGTATYASRRVRTQASRTSSQDRTQFPASTFEQAPQNGSQRVLRMTPARRRRQLSNLYPFFPPATTNQTQIPLSRPLTRLQRLHHNTIEDVSFAPRQTDAIAPNLLRRSRTRSSSYNGQEISPNTGIAYNSSESTRHTLPISETMFDIRRPRSSSVDAIINGDLDNDLTRPNVRFSDRLRRSNTHRGSSTRQYSSSISLSGTSSSNSSSSTAGTQTDPLAASPQRSRRRVARISARRLFNFGGQGTESNSNNNNHNSNINNEDNDTESHHLGRFLSIAAAATAASLVASQENAVIEAERAANEGHDGSFESFLAALQRRRREASNRPTNQSVTASSSPEGQDSSADNNTPGSQPSQPMSFFRLFRFGGSRSSTQQNISPETSTSSIPNVTNDTSSSNASNTPHMVPVIIIGIRSVQPRDDPNGNSSSSQNTDNNSTNPESRNNSSRPSRTRSSSTSNRASARSTTASTATQTPPARSWIIYVLGGTYPSTHPILTTPSLFSDNPTYEDMMLLSSLIGPARPATTTQSEIDANLPIALYNESTVTEYDLLGNAEKCQVCLCDYIANEEVRVLNCRHGFHRECIDKVSSLSYQNSTFILDLFNSACYIYYILRCLSSFFVVAY